MSLLRCGCKLHKFDASLDVLIFALAASYNVKIWWTSKQHIYYVHSTQCVTKDLLKVILIDSMFYTPCLVIVYANLPHPQAPFPIFSIRNKSKISSPMMMISDFAQPQNIHKTILCIICGMGGQAGNNGVGREAENRFSGIFRWISKSIDDDKVVWGRKSWHIFISHTALGTVAMSIDSINIPALPRYDVVQHAKYGFGNKSDTKYNSICM